MARQRLTWGQGRTADMDKKADPYTMNQDHKNPPVEKYKTGDPSTWAEDPNMATPWKTEGRNEVGLPAAKQAREAVAAARKLEDKAIKCITIAQRMLPGASEEDIEAQATDFMYLPERSVIATLQRQSVVAESLAKKAGDDEEEGEEEGEEEEKKEEKKESSEEKEAVKKDDEEEAKKEEEEEPKKEAEDDKEAKKCDEEEAKKEEEEEPKKEAEDSKEAEEDKEAKKKKYEKEEKKEEMKEEEKKEAEDKEASEPDLLDNIFNTELPTEKTGAKKLSGLVKKASDGGTDLNKIWSAPPDISNVFQNK